MELNMDKIFRQGWVLAAREDIRPDRQEGGEKLGGYLLLVSNGDLSPLLPGFKLRYCSDQKCRNSFPNIKLHV
jgi:hypothetical protein